MPPDPSSAASPWDRGYVHADEAALDALRADARLAGLVATHGPYRWELRPPFPALTGSIVSQSVSTASAAAVHERLEATVDITPTAVLDADPDALRATGLSWGKVEAIRRVAAFAHGGGLAGIAGLDDRGVAERLTALKGIGPWTADMFLIFSLGRLDVWPVGDLAVRKEAERRFDVQGRGAVRDAGERFRPYRSAVAWYLWKAGGGPAQS